MLQVYDTLFTITLLGYQPEPVPGIVGVVVRGPLRFLHHPFTGHCAVSAR